MITECAKGETHAATLILECLEKNGRKFDVTEALRMIAEASDPQWELKSVQAAVQLVFVGATRLTHLRCTRGKTSEAATNPDDGDGPPLCAAAVR
ncbi:hypothetical protein [Actinacidiphila yeochonensis]|uniref:hypothetical protein n=1 Tax=Actinacidiphila yeochonensis TaxID=89050 RepID=UPI000567E5D0|nr:hypothetical protein [Actinacidiphila yeochonensis]